MGQWPTDGDRANILVVDDLPENLLVYRSVLEELGQNVITAQSGPEALKHLLQHDFAVILLDVNMTEMDGFETAALIRKRKRSALTPIIFVTAYVDELRTVQGYAHGAVDYIPSPVVPEVLRAKVKVFVELFRMHEQVKRQAAERVALAEERAKREAAEEATLRSSFLAEAARVLANSLDPEATLHSMARLVVPFLADLSIACLADDKRRPGRTEWVWIDTPRGTDTALFAANLSFSAVLAEAIERVLASGKPEILEQLDHALVAREAVEPAVNGSSSSLPRLPLESAVILPLNARSKTLGALALAFGPSGRRHHAPDLSLADELAGRAGMALHNALLVRDIQEADRRKDEFLAMLAHELRNPLAPIRNAVHVMRLLGPTDPELQRARDLIERQVRHLTRMVDDLLDVSRITRGKIRLELEPVDVAAAVAVAVETSRPMIDSRKHELTVSMPRQPLQVRADLARLAQILANLLNNAAKYTPERGQIYLTVERQGQEAVFRVRDTGSGIPREMLPHIFDLFTQVDHSLDRAQGGLGIGLTLVRRLVDMHQGSVQATSDGPGRGSEFVVRLPLLPENQTEPANTPAADAAIVPAAHRRVLVVDDNVDSAVSLALLLQLEGHEVRTAHDGPAALDLAQSFRPEVVFLDIGLPMMDGYEVARRLRQLLPSESFVLAALTGYGHEEDRLRSEQAGFNAHLIKPVDPAAVHRLLATEPAAVSAKP
jgi:signal transduction histidine kinase/DNA-binding response OmpR family regulator